MIKIFSSFNGDVEMGISAQIKGEGKGLFTDESLALFNGTAVFPIIVILIFSIAITTIKLTIRSVIVIAKRSLNSLH